MAYTEGDGIWRTIRGRRVFLQNSKSLYASMVRSGKFPEMKKPGGTVNKPDSGRFSGTEEAKAAEESESAATSLSNNTESVSEAAEKSESSATPLFNSTGSISESSVSENREFFYGKSVEEIDSILKEQGYQTTRRKSIHESSRAQIIVITNSDKHRNITQVQVSPGSRRHGDVPYVKFSTSDIGRLKVIDATEAEYRANERKNQEKEHAILFFRRT